MTKIYVFFISDGTGITAESFGQSLLAQFENLEFIRITRPYVNTAEKARQLCKELTTLYKQKTPKILVFSTIV
ncbi:MAG: kinase/pyrophosphorylase, partial [Endozoicomonadaceae bacterium]|nr:kinase/pyrophosphorylase [Endozoicomonadaceae bacterium]